MRFQIISLFPELMESLLAVGLLGKAQEKDLVSLESINPREFTTDVHQSVDDAPFGGGGGMLMLPEPLTKSIEEFDRRSTERQQPRARRILLTPQGKPLKQRDARRLAKESSLMLMCGRYEGVDERVRVQMDEEISLGDFVLNGGEVAAMALIEAVSRLVPGVLGNASSAVEESHSAGLLEYPHYTRPRDFRGQEVPEVLLSGDHARVGRWRRQLALERTRDRRPDLFAQHLLTAEDRQLLGTAEASGRRVYVALVHHPVRDRAGDTVTTAVTTLDVHDIARSAKTYGLAGYFVVTPIEAQHTLVQRILDHWESGAGKKRMPERSQALELVQTTTDIAGALERIRKTEGRAPQVWATSARTEPGQALLAGSQARALIATNEPILILFGTGHGLATHVLEDAHAILDPIHGAGQYNHLSVRSAVAIVLDKLLGQNDG